MRRKASGRRCLLCGRPGAVRASGPLSVIREGRRVLLSSVPHDHCPRCGEDVFDPREIEAAWRRALLRKAL